MSFVVGGDLQEVIRAVRPERTLITTYAASLSYLEAGLLDRLREHGRPAVRLLVDAQLHANCLGEVGVRYNGVRYEAFPVSVGGGYRFHPKTYALYTDTEAVLVVASANLTVPGFRRNWEMFDVLRVRRATRGERGDSHADAPALASYCGFLEELVSSAVQMSASAGDAVREVARDIRTMMGDAGSAPASHGPWFLHSLRTPILDQILGIVDAGQVTHVTAYSPYFDQGAHAVRKLTSAFPKARKIRIVLDPASEVAFNGVSLRKVEARLEVLRVTPRDGEARRFLHGKSLALRTERGTWVVCGSANLTAAGMCGAAAPVSGQGNGNVEAVVIRFVPDLQAAKKLLAVVPAEPWPEWKNADASGLVLEDEVVPPDKLHILDADVENDIVRCVLSAASWDRPTNVTTGITIHVDHGSERVSMRVDTISTTAQTVTLEASCSNSAFLTSDEAGRVEVEVRGPGKRTRTALAWLRRPVELRQTAASVSLRQHLRPLRNTPTPDADTLIEVHSALCALLQRVGRGGEVVNGALPSRASGAAGRSTTGGGILVLSDLLADEDESDATQSRTTGRASRGLRAITDALRAHLLTPGATNGDGLRNHIPTELPASASIRVGSTHVAARGTALRARRSRLTTGEAAQIAQLASTFAGSLRQVPPTAEGVRSIIDIAEPIGTVLLAADVVRAPASTVTDGSRPALLEALVAWWTALLGASPAPDGAPQGVLVRAWAIPTLRPVLADILAESAATVGAGLVGLAAGVSVARQLVTHELPDDTRLDDCLTGLALLTGRVEPLASSPWFVALSERVRQSTAWWPEELRDATPHVLWETTPPAPRSLTTIARWDALTAKAGVTPVAGDVYPQGLLNRLARVRGRYSDPVARFDPVTRTTSCCSDVATATDFSQKVLAPWPQVAECPSCGRLIGPPAWGCVLTRAVVEWWQNEGASASGASAP